MSEIKITIEQAEAAIARHNEIAELFRDIRNYHTFFIPSEPGLNFDRTKKAIAAQRLLFEMSALEPVLPRIAPGVLPDDHEVFDTSNAD